MPVPNHVHVILVPSDEDGLRRTFADLHRRYTGFVSARARTTGHLWQDRYGSVVMDEPHLCNAIHYVSLISVRARLVKWARDWGWSSERAHLAGWDDSVVRVGDFARFLDEGVNEDAAYAALRRDRRASDRRCGLAGGIEGADRPVPCPSASWAQAKKRNLVNCRRNTIVIATNCHRDIDRQYWM